MESTAREAKTQRDVWMFRAIALTVLLVVLAGVAVLSIMFLALGSPGCDPACDYSTYGFASTAFTIFSVALVAVTAASLFVLRRSGCVVLASPIVGLALLIVGWVVAYAIGSVAMQPAP